MAINPTSGILRQFDENGRINFLLPNDSTLRKDIGNWSTFDDGAVSTPVDLTGGSPTVVTVARNTSFSSKGSLRISHSANNGQGEGAFVTTQTIEAKHYATMCDIEFIYKTSSGYVDDDLQIWVYDVTNSALIQPSAYKLKASLTPSQFKAQFQTSATGASYRVGFFCPNTTATAYDLDIDDVVVGPSIYNYGMPGYDPKDYTPTFSNLGTGSVVIDYFKHSKVGKFLIVDFRVRKDGSSGTGVGNIKFTLPTGLVPDSSFNQACGYASGTTSNINMSLYWQPSDATNIYFVQNDNSYLIGSEWAANLEITGQLRLPILGWSSSVQMSSDADQRLCAFSAYKAADQTGINPNNSAVKLQFDTDSAASNAFDTHGAFDAATNYRFTAPISGKFRVECQASMSGTNVLANLYQLRLYKNGSHLLTLDEQTPATSERVGFDGSALIELVANDYIEIYLFGAGNNSASTLTVFGAGNGMRFSASIVQGPSAIGATTLIIARYETAAGQSIPNSTDTVVDYGTKTFDTHNAVTTGASWKFTAPAAGYYEITACITWGTSATNFSGYTALRKNGSYVSQLHHNSTKMMDTDNERLFSKGNDIIKLNAGDYIDVMARQNSGGGYSLLTDAAFNYVSVKRIGI